MQIREGIKSLTWSDGLAVALFCLASVFGIILYWAEKTVLTAVLSVVGMAVLMGYPIFHFFRSARNRVEVSVVIVILIGLFGWKIWPSPPQQVAVEQPHSGTVKTLESSPTTLPVPKMKPPRHAQTQPGTVANPPVTLTNSPGSAVSVNQQGGITAGTINIDTHPHLKMTDSQAAGVTEAMRPFAGRPAFILVNNGNAELVEFGNRLNEALLAAQVKSDLAQGVSMSEGKEAPKVLFVGFKTKTADLASALINAIVKNHILDGGQISYHQYGDKSQDQLQIILSRPD
jgi:hypothetical protein